MYLQMADDAERFRPAHPTGGGREKLVGSANQKVSCCRVTAALRAQIIELRQAELTLGAGKHL